MPTDLEDVLNSLLEPALLVNLEGMIGTANRAAKSRAGPGLEGRSLYEFAGASSRNLQHYLAHCTGTTSPLLGAIYLPSASGVGKFRCYGHLVSPTENPCIFLRCAVTARTCSRSASFAERIIHSKQV